MINLIYNQIKINPSYFFFPFRDILGAERKFGGKKRRLEFANVLLPGGTLQILNRNNTAGSLSFFKNRI